MKKASITEAKNRLSALIDGLIRGAPVLIVDRRRRPLNIEFVQQQTIANKRRMEEKDPVARARNFDELAAIAADPVAHRAYLLRASLLDSVRKSAQLAHNVERHPAVGGQL